MHVQPPAKYFHDVDDRLLAVAQYLIESGYVVYTTYDAAVVSYCSLPNVDKAVALASLFDVQIQLAPSSDNVSVSKFLLVGYPTSTMVDLRRPSALDEVHAAVRALSVCESDRFGI